MAERGWALVTGAARRIGRALALTAARAGYDVLVHHRSSRGRRRRDRRGRSKRWAAARATVAADLADAAACRALVAAAAIR